MYSYKRDSAEDESEKKTNFPDFSGLPTLDLQTFQDLRAMIDDDLAFSDLITIYLSSAETLVDNIQMAFADNDVDRLKISSHSLKSTSASIGGTKLSQISKFIEPTSKEGKVSITAEFISDILVQEYNSLIAMIKSYVIDNMANK